jgi:hypothetical protein
LENFKMCMTLHDLLVWLPVRLGIATNDQRSCHPDV